MATGEVLTRCERGHRYQEFLAFLRHIEASVPENLNIHLIVDNYASNKHPEVRAGQGGALDGHDRGHPPRMNSPTGPSTTGSRPVARANSAASLAPSPHGEIPSSVAARYRVW